MNDLEFKMILKAKLTRQINNLKEKGNSDDFCKGVVTAYQNVIWLIDLHDNNSKTTQ